MCTVLDIFMKTYNEYMCVEYILPPSPPPSYPVMVDNGYQLDKI